MKHGTVCTLWTLCTLAIFAQPLSALPARSLERAEVFATCSGRLSALATRQRAMHDKAARHSQSLAQMFDMLLDATMPDVLDQGVPARQSTLWRSRGWGEIAALLSHLDRAENRQSALLSVQARIEDCRNLVLPNG